MFPEDLIPLDTEEEKLFGLVLWCPACHTRQANKSTSGCVACGDARYIIKAGLIGLYRYINFLTKTSGQEQS